jgi:hypothetical protein
MHFHSLARADAVWAVCFSVTAMTSAQIGASPKQRLQEVIRFQCGGRHEDGAPGMFDTLMAELRTCEWTGVSGYA